MKIIDSIIEINGRIVIYAKNTVAIGSKVKIFEALKKEKVLKNVRFQISKEKFCELFIDYRPLFNRR